jgi:two-component system alkaline phosphatase synthesis response regulator PhoP
MNNILAIGLEKSDSNKFDQHLSDKGLFFIYCTNILEAIGHLETTKIHLVIYQAKTGDKELVEVFNTLEIFLGKNKIPVFLVVGWDEIGTVKKALEIGVENLIFKPFDFQIIEKKIKNQILKRKFINFIDYEPFKIFFENNKVPMIVAKHMRVSFVNQAFLDIVSSDTIDYTGVKLAEMFQFENDPIKYYELKKLDSGLIQFCMINKVLLKGMEKIIVDLLLVKSTSGLILVQLNVLQNNDSLKDTSKFYASRSEKISKNSEKFIKSGLTKRELDVLKLSANGLPIKIIAQELKLSARTVEKHRANIMQKFGVKNMIEVMNHL